MWYISSSENKSSVSYLIILLVTNQSRTNFNVGRKALTAFSHFLFYIYQGINGSLETTLSHISWLLYWSGTESNTKGQVSTALTSISWVSSHSGTNCIVEG